ncbi:MAG: hypothetical protein JWO03_3948 [Bacteroidetes bacterium]|nr:hypothetical protein [Bacteroidota bacterium]
MKNKATPENGGDMSLSLLNKVEDVTDEKVATPPVRRRASDLEEYYHYLMATRPDDQMDALVQTIAEVGLGDTPLYKAAVAQAAAIRKMNTDNN